MIIRAMATIAADCLRLLAKNDIFMKVGLIERIGEK
jgi:hypothetical protein